MQQRRASDHGASTVIEHRQRGNSSGTGGNTGISFIAQVKMRLKREKSNRTNHGNNNSQTPSHSLSSSSSPHRFVPHRPYSCDVDTLTSEGGGHFHHPDFYHHQTTVASGRQIRSRLASLGNRRMNSSQQNLAKVIDNEDTVTEKSPILSNKARPPMAAEEDFAVESSVSCSPEDQKPAPQDTYITRPPMVHCPSAPGVTPYQQNSSEKCQQKTQPSSTPHVQSVSSSDECTRSGLTWCNRSMGNETSRAAGRCQPRAQGQHQLKVVVNNGDACASEHGSVLIDRLQRQFNGTGSGKGGGGGGPASHQPSPAAAALSTSVGSPHQSKNEPGSSTSLAARHGNCQNLVVSVTSFDGSTAITSFSAPYHPTDRHQYQRSSSAKTPDVQAQTRSPRGSLRRGKAVDLSSYENNQATVASVSTSNSPVKENQKCSSASSAVLSGTNTVGRSKRHSILRKLIGGGGSGSRNGSSEDTSNCGSPSSSYCPPSGTLMANAYGPSATTGARSVSSAGLTIQSIGPEAVSYSARSDFSSDSSDFKYEERVRRRIFAHYDCLSIGADPKALLNGTSRLKDANLNATTGASQASKPFLISAATGAPATSQNLEPGLLSPDDPSGTLEQQQSGMGKSNDILLSCPYFLNEIGGEPIRYISLCRDTYGQSDKNLPLACTCPGCMYAYEQDGPSLAVPPPCSGYQSQQVDENMETWHQTATAAEASVLENLSNVYLGGRLCAKRQPQLVMEHVDQGAFYYRHCFVGRAHQNYLGIDENLGPLAISVVREKMELADPRRFALTSPYLYRLIIRLSDLTTFRGAILEESLPSYLSAKETREQQLQSSGSGQNTPGASSGPCNVSGMTTGVAGTVVSVATGSSRGKIPVKELLELVIPELQTSCLRLAVPVPRTEELLLKLDEQAVYTRYKVGILYCRAQQSTEEQMYNNEVAGPAFDEFLDLLGQRVRLKGFDKYKGGLDCKGDTTGSYSLYTCYQQYEIMFHVSTMLPFTPQNRQQLSRKRHIGNDIVTVVFQEPGALPFSPQTVRSHFQHVFIVVRVHNPNTDNVRYTVSVSRCKDVPRFGPPLPPGATFPKSKDFRDLILTKIINAENAVHKSEKFSTMAARTRREFMRDLAENHTTSHTLDGGAPGKIASILLGGSAKRKDRPKPKLYVDSFVRGAIVWDVQVLTQVEDFSLCRPVECYLGISADYVVLIEQATKDVLFCTQTHSVIAWTSHGNSLKLYYDHADVIILRTLDDEDSCEMQEIVKRLHSTTKGCETVEMILRRNSNGQMGFHIQHEGIVTDVDMYGFAWQAGLRQGSRIVEICKVSVATLTYERMLELLQTSVNIRVLVVTPLEDGSPRRGCEDPYCSTVFCDDWPLPPSSGSFSSSRTCLDMVGTGPMGHRPSLALPQERKPSMSRAQLSEGHGGYESNMRRQTAGQQQAMLRAQKMSDVGPGSGYRSASGQCGHANCASYFASKSLDDIQHKRDRRYSEDIRCTSADHGSFLGGPHFRYRPQGSKLSTVGWYGDDHGSATSGDAPAPRTDTLSSSGSTASSEVSTEADATAKRKPTRPSELKRRVDRANSDMLQRVAAVASVLERTSTDPSSAGVAGTPPRAPALQPRNYRNYKCHSLALSAALTTGSGSSSGLGSVSGRSSPVSLSSGHLAVPTGKHRSTAASAAVQQNLLRLISDLESAGEIEEAMIISSALQRLSEDSSRHQRLIASAQYHTSSPKCSGQIRQRSPEKDRGVEWSSLVDAAARAIEGLSHRAATASNTGSPELSGYRLRLQAALQRVKLLEEKVDRVQMELDAERESKREMEIEVLRLRDVNKRLEEECTHAKMELKKFTEWFFNAVENTTSTGTGLSSANLPPGIIPFVDDIERKNN